MSANSATPDHMLHAILTRARDLEERITRGMSIAVQSDSQSKTFNLVSRRLKTSVIRPLREALAEVQRTYGSKLNVRTESDSTATDSTPVLSIMGLGDDMWALAKDATTLQLNAAMPVET